MTFISWVLGDEENGLDDTLCTEDGTRKRKKGKHSAQKLSELQKEKVTTVKCLNYGKVKISIWDQNLMDRNFSVFWLTT